MPEPERLTELYFTDHTRLPATYTIGESQVVKFTIHNLEYRTTHYSYRITEQAQDGATPKTIAKGEVTLKQDQYARPEVPVVLSDVGANGKVSVDLVGRSETIDYLVTQKEGL